MKNNYKPLPKKFFQRPATNVALDLLGKKLVRDLYGNILSGIITETEAYLGETDSASHAYPGKTDRNAILWGEGGHAYIYLIYGMYSMLNIVADRKGIAAGVLIRSLFPLEGIEILRKNRNDAKNLCNGPGKLCQALSISIRQKGLDLTAGKQLWVCEYSETGPSEFEALPRVGINYALKKDREALLRFRSKKDYPLL